MEQLLRDMYYLIKTDLLLSFLKGASLLIGGGLILFMITAAIKEMGLKSNDIFIGCLVILGILILSTICGAFLTALLSGVPQ